METPNLERWRHWCSNYPTTDNFVTATWLWMVGSALQRRVWWGSYDKPIFPNQYIFLVSEPGVGKSMVTDDGKDIFHSLIYRGADNTSNSLANCNDRIGKPLFSVAADSTTFEAMVTFTAKSRRIAINKDGRAFNGPDKKPYAHCSPSFILDELTSIFHKNMDQMVNLLLTGWTCGRHYSRDTVSRGVETVENLCLNIIGGTQPDRFARLAQNEILSSGFLRRGFIVYGDKNRFERAYIDHTAEMRKSKNKLHAHLYKLAFLFGQIQIAPDAFEYYKSWWETPGRARANPSPRLDHYYASQNLHLIKAALCFHFGETDSMILTLGAMQKAMEWITSVEKSMHLAFTGAAGQRAEITNSLLAYMKTVRTPQRAVELYIDFVEVMEYEDFCKLIGDLVFARKLIRVDDDKYIANIKT